MRLRNPRVWIALASAGLVLTLAIAELGRASPGPLAAVHQRDSRLTGFGSCSQCHGGWFGSMAESCLECHNIIGDQIDAGAGLHGALDKRKAAQCALCHSDHHGADFAIVNRQSFAQAGVAKPEEFDHGFVGFEMGGKHLELACAECHKNAQAGVLGEGETRYIGLTKACASCHEDPHEGRMVVSCAQCHGQESFDVLYSLGHEKHLPLTGGHAGVSCRTCHAQGEQHSLEALGHGVANAARTCVSCHENAHRTPFADACAACHVAEHENFDAATVTPGQHAESGFLLDRPHDEVSCDRCHADAGYPGRKQDDCQSCHTDPHAGQFEQTCIECHDRHRFAPHAFTTKKHAVTSFALTGRHLEADCYGCHKEPETHKPRVFAGTAGDCASCHKDAHSGFFDKRAALLADDKNKRRVPQDTCAQCHVTTEFRQAQEFDHRLWTGFAVEGAHSQAECESCHVRRKKPDESGRTFGRIENYTGCVSCHKDPHRGGFDRPHHPVKVKGRADCARCHVQTSFRALRNDFDHGVWTGFKLDGAHDEAKCSACHTPLRRPDKLGRTWKKAKSSRCADCHDSPHGNQFLTTSCESCHQTAKSFSTLDFNHNKDARFPLDKMHAAVDCASCHKPFRGIVRYRPLGRRCIDCHKAQRDPLRRRGK